MAYRPVRFTVTVRLFIITSFLEEGGCLRILKRVQLGDLSLNTVFLKTTRFRETTEAIR